jgi:hypothetical protein
MRVTGLTVVGAVRASVEALGDALDPADIGLVKMAEMYAEQIDSHGDAHRLLKRVDDLVDQALRDPAGHGTAYELGIIVDRLTRALDSGKTLVDSGRQLQSVLESLGVGPKARAAIAGRKPPAEPPAGAAPVPDAAGPADPVREKMDALRRRAGFTVVGGRVAGDE